MCYERSSGTLAADETATRGLGSAHYTRDASPQQQSVDRLLVNLKTVYILYANRNSQMRLSSDAPQRLDIFLVLAVRRAYAASTSTAGAAGAAAAGAAATADVSSASRRASSSGPHRDATCFEPLRRA